MNSSVRAALFTAIAGFLAASAKPARAQEWSAGRTTPNLQEIFAIDGTGETFWPYGSEDVADDGGNFPPAEQAIDVRTAYATTSAQEFWVRVYFSSTSAPPDTTLAYVFIDADRSQTSGGSAAASNVDAAFTADPSGGGYEYVLAADAGSDEPRLWQWDNGQRQFVTVPLNPPDGAASSGVDVDPLGINGKSHGYVQALVSLDLVGLTQACSANLYVRSVNTRSDLGPGDLDVLERVSCVPADDNENRVPDVIVPPEGCTSDDQCPAGGVCVDRRCVLAAPCLDDTDCREGEACSADDRCVAQPGGTCTSNDQCSGRICQSGTCQPCTAAADCGGLACGPDGRCTSGAGAGDDDDDDSPTLLPGEEVQGGACSCRAAPLPPHRAVLLLLGLPLLLLFRRR